MVRKDRWTNIWYRSMQLIRNLLLRPRLAFDYKKAFASAQQSWWYISMQGELESWNGVIDPSVSTMNVDHVIELDMIVTYFTESFTAGDGFSENQWNLVRDFISSQGQKVVVSGANGGSVRVFLSS